MIPTHHLLHENNQSHTTVDLFITPKTQSVTSFSQSESRFIAGHDFIELSIPYRIPRPPPQTITSRCLSKIPAGQIFTALLPKLTPLSLSIAATHSVDTLTKSLTEAISTSFNEIAPLKTFTIPSKHKPCVSPQVISKIKQRDQAYKTAHRSNSQLDIAHFKSLRSAVSNLLDSC